MQLPAVGECDLLHTRRCLLAYVRRSSNLRMIGLCLPNKWNG
jgi:hypothetical protein